MGTDISDNIKMRKINCKLGVLTRPNGSAFLCQGGTAALAGVYGPIEVKIQNMLIDKASVETHYRPKSGMPGISDRLTESIIKNTCNAALLSVLYPRSSIVVVIQEMQNCGGFLACAINAACLAVLHSGVQMKFLIAAVSCAIDGKDELHLDPDKMVMEQAKATFVLAFDNVDKHIVTSHTSGSFTVKQFEEALELCKIASEDIFKFYKSVISQEFVK